MFATPTGYANGSQSNCLVFLNKDSGGYYESYGASTSLQISTAAITLPATDLSTTYYYTIWYL